MSTYEGDPMDAYPIYGGGNVTEWYCNRCGLKLSYRHTACPKCFPGLKDLVRMSEVERKQWQPQ